MRADHRRVEAAAASGRAARVGAPVRRRNTALEIAAVGLGALLFLSLALAKMERDLVNLVLALLLR